MCQINDVQITGSQPWSATGNPSSITVDARATACDRLRFEVYRNQGDSTPLYSATDRPVSSSGVASAQFAVTPDKNITCGDVLWVVAACQTDPTCFSRGEVRVVCKGFDGADTCPAIGPPLTVQPPVDTNADCVAGGTYTITIGGTWPSGTTFSWSLSQNSQFTPTGQHGVAFVLQHPVGTPATTVLAQVEVPGCTDVFSSVTIPEADEGNCPSQITIAVNGPSGPLPVPPDGVTYTGLQPGDYEVVVTSPTGNDISFEWYRDNVMQPATIGAPEVFTLSGLAGGISTTIAVRVQEQCCNALLDTIILQTDPDDGTPKDPGGGGGETDPTDPNPPDPPVINWPCLILGILVALALVVGLVSLVVTATGPMAILAFPVLVTSAVALLIAGILLLLICRPSLCRILRILAWSLKWAIVLGAIIAIGALSLTAIMVVIVYGIIIAAIEWALARNGCRDPSMWSFP